MFGIFMCIHTCASAEKILKYCFLEKIIKFRDLTFQFSSKKISTIVFILFFFHSDMPVVSLEDFNHFFSFFNSFLKVSFTQSHSHLSPETYLSLRFISITKKFI